MYKHLKTGSIVAALLKHNGNRSAAARELGCVTRTISRRIRTDGIEIAPSRTVYSVKEMKDAITKHNGVIIKVAEELGMSRGGIQARLRKNKSLKNHLIFIRQAKKTEAKPVIRDWSTYSTDNEEHRKNTTQVGTLYQYMFETLTMCKGLHPHRCTGEYLNHDIIVYNNNQKSIRVQVKGTNTRPEGLANGFKIRAAFAELFVKGAQRKRRHPNPSHACEIDIFAAYFEQADTWYLIPVEAITSTTLTTFPLLKGSKAQYEQYKENWKILK